MTKMDSASILAAPTVNPYEMSHYKYLSTTWWNKESLVNTLHVMNKLRIPWIVDKLVETKVITKDTAKSSKPLKGLHILDVGCGGGFATEPLARLGCKIVGIDPCSALIDLAKERLSQSPDISGNVTYICGTMEDHSEHNYEKYDVVLVYEVLDHVNEQELFLELCVKCLKPGGLITLSTFNQTWMSWLIGIIFFEYITGSIPLGTHSWYKFISPEDVEKILAKYNCKTKGVRGMYYIPVWRAWYWTCYTGVTYILCAMKNKH